MSGQGVLLAFLCLADVTKVNNVIPQNPHKDANNHKYFTVANSTVSSLVLSFPSDRTSFGGNYWGSGKL